MSTCSPAISPCSSQGVPVQLRGRSSDALNQELASFPPPFWSGRIAGRNPEQIVQDALRLVAL
eukprot:9096858-Pyramimonas_sp.AAC.1